MSTSEQPKIAERKIGNALVEQAKADFRIYLLPAAVGGVTGVLAFGAVLAASKALNGGSWVGGEIELTESTIKFHPNAANRAIHQTDYDLEIPLRDIRDVKDEPGLITGIIRLLTDRGILKIRVYGAKSFAKRIRDYVVAARSEIE